jgi:hypothetical protein
MEKHRKDLVEVIVAFETKDPQIGKLIERIKGGFNKHLEFQYSETLRRASDAPQEEAKE